MPKVMSRPGPSGEVVVQGNTATLRDEEDGWCVDVVLEDDVQADSHVKDVCLWLTVGENHPTVHASAAVYLLPEQARMVGRMLLAQADAAEGKEVP